LFPRHTPLTSPCHPAPSSRHTPSHHSHPRPPATHPAPRFPILLMFRPHPPARRKQLHALDSGKRSNRNHVPRLFRHNVTHDYIHLRRRVRHPAFVSERVHRVSTFL